MRELKDYFCTETQSEALIKLGCDYDVLAVLTGSTLIQVPINYKPHPVEIKIFLRSQALDFFRDKGYKFWIYKDDTYMYNLEFDYGILGLQGYQTYHEAESALIDKLIELLESEAQHGNNTK